MPPDDSLEGREVQTMSVESGTVAMIARGEIDQQITTAKKYPRSIKKFLDEASQMATLNESIAQQCIYALPRDGKTIEGASARFGEIIASAWGNCRAGARIVNEGPEFVTAQGVFQDLERNVAITYEVQRRITNSRGQRYKPDMIGVTANAACSIALRNAILKGVPKAFWEPVYHKARAVVAGDLQTLANKRANAIQQFVIFGVSEAQILAKLGRVGVADITVDDLVALFGLLTAIKDGDTTPEQAFALETSTHVPGPQEKTDMQGGMQTQRSTTTATSTPEVQGNGGSSVDVQRSNGTPADTGVASTPGGSGSDLPTEPRGPGFITAGGMNMMRAKAKNVGKTVADVCVQFNVAKLCDLTLDQSNEALAWLRTFNA